MSNLTELKWQDASGVEGVYCKKTNSYIKDALWFCSTLVADYVIKCDEDTGRYIVNYGGRTENEYDTVEEAKHWCEYKHYASKMQPYVKPSPTEVYELAFDCDDSYFTVFMTTDKQAALDFMESVKDADQDFISNYGFDDDTDELLIEQYNDNHPLKPYANQIFEPIHEDSFSEWARSYAGNSLVSQMSIIEHELFVKQGE